MLLGAEGVSVDVVHHKSGSVPRCARVLITGRTPQLSLPRRCFTRALAWRLSGLHWPPWGPACVQQASDAAAMRRGDITTAWRSGV